MKSAAKGIGLLVVVLGVLVGAAAWWLNGDAPLLATKHRAEVESAAANPGTSAPATADPNNAAKRLEETPATDASATATADAAATGPTAEFLAGVVVDPNGRPIVGAEVSFGPNAFARAQRPPRRFRFANVVRTNDEAAPRTIQTRTNGDGAFRLPKVARSEGLELKIDHPDYVLFTRNDIILPATGLEIGRIVLEPGALISGQVFGPDGAKLANVDVSLRDAPDEPKNARGFLNFSFNFGPRGGRSTKTDAEGRFHLAGMPKGRAQVVAKADGFVETNSDTVELKPLEEVPNVVLHLERGHTIRGVVRDAKGKPIAGAAVDASSGDGFNNFARMMNGEPDHETDAEGRFTLTGLKPAIYELNVDAEGFAQKSVAGIDSSVTAPVEITLGESARVAGTVRIKNSADVVKNVKVQLTRYWGDNTPSMQFDTPDSENHATTDGAFLIHDVEPGNYRVVARGDGTARGTSAVIEVKEGENLDNVQIDVERGAILSGRLLDLATGAPIANANVSAFTVAEPPQGMDRRAVRVISRIGGRSGMKFDPFHENVGRTKSDAEGRFELPNLSAGSYTIEATHVDYATARSAPQEVVAATAKEGVELRLGHGGAVEGSVLGIDGKPRAGDRIDVESKSVDGVSLSGVTDANGAYHIEHVPAGEAVATREESDDGANAGVAMMFRAIATSGADEPDPGKHFTVEEGAVARVDFSQIEKPYVEGIVTCSDGPVAGAIVSASLDGGGPRGMVIFGGDQKQVTTGADGHYRLADLDPGSWRVTVRHPQGLVPVSASLVLVAGMPTRQDFALEGGVIEGVVTGQKGHQKLEGATISVVRVTGDDGSNSGTVVGNVVFASRASGRRRGGSYRSMRFGGGDDGSTRVATDRDGHYRVPWVPAGKYKVTVSHSGFLDTQSGDVDMASNAHVADVNVELPPAATLHVTLRSKSTGQVLANSPVQLNSDDGDSQFGMTDAEGVAKFENLKPGKWNVTGKKDWNDAEGQKKSVTCEAERTTEVTVDV